jgi:nitroreductase
MSEISRSERKSMRWSAAIISAGLFLILLQVAEQTFAVIYWGKHFSDTGMLYTGVGVLLVGAVLMAFITFCSRLGTDAAPASEPPVSPQSPTFSGKPTTELKLIPLPDYVELSSEQMHWRADAFYEEMRRRHSVREFAPRPVPRELIETCIAAAATAPSGANHQPWHFAVIGNAALKKRIRDDAEEKERTFQDSHAGKEWLEALKPLGTDAEKPFLETAPWLICIFGAGASASADGVVRRNYNIAESVSIAAGFLIAALHRAGLATLTHAPVNSLKEICCRPATDKPYILLAAGYPASGARIPQHATEKKPLKEITTFFE